MPSKSLAQQRLFGMVHAYQKGELKNPSAKVVALAKTISKEDARAFATKRETEGHPNKDKADRP